MPKQTRDPDRDAAIIRLARGGLSHRAIAAEVRCSTEVVSRTLAASGVTDELRLLRERAAADRAARDVAIMARWRSGWRLAAIGEAFGLAPRSVETIIRDRLADERAAAARADLLERLPTAARMLADRAPTKPMATRVIGPGFCGRDPDVEAADPIAAERDAAPLWGGRYPKGPSGSMSMFSSPAAACEAVA